MDNTKESLEYFNTAKKILGEDKLLEYQVKEITNKAVVNDPLPSTTFDALDDGGLITIDTSRGKVTLRDIVSYDFVIFKKINSPIHRMIVDGVDNTVTTEEDMFVLIYQFTHTCKEIRTILKSGGEDLLVETSMDVIADNYSVTDISKLVEGVMKLMARANSTNTVYHNYTDSDTKKKI